MGWGPDELRVWAAGFDHHAGLLRRHGHPLVLEGIRKLGVDRAHKPNFGLIHQTLKNEAGWGLVEVDGLIPNTSYFDLAAHRMLPATQFIRGPQEIFTFRWIDVLHDMQHLPLLLEPSIARFLEVLGRIGVAASDRDDALLFREVERVIWHLGERGLIHADGEVRFWGALISSFEPEIAHVQTHRDLIVPWSLEAARTCPLPWEGRFDYEIGEFQNVYFILRSFSELVPDVNAWASSLGLSG